MNPLGENLGNYRIARLIGHGGFADVYLGEHIYLKTKAAIKVLHTRVGQDQNSIQYFLNEAQTIARLAHPHIIRVLEFGIEQGTPYLVMEFAPNGTLRQHLPRQVPLSVAMAIYYARQVASALQYAHDSQLIHRDVKPENFLLGTNYEVLLGDFGISSLAHSSKSLSTQDVAGTIAYMAPEQIEGKARQASDQYALGVVIYEWLTGRYPFTGSFMEIATQHLFTPPPAPRSIDPSIPAEVEEVLLIALAKKPDNRFLSVEVFARALEQAALATLSPAESMWLKQPPNSPEMRDLLQKTLGVATMMAVPTLHPGEVATILPRVEGVQTPVLSSEAPVLLATTGKSPYVSRRVFFGGLATFAAVVGGGTYALWEMGVLSSRAQVVTPTPTPAATRAAQTPTPSPTQTPDPTPEPTTGPLVTQPIVFSQGTEVFSVAWNRNGTQVASSGNGSLIQIWNPLTAQGLSSLSTGQDHIYSLAWSSGGSFLAASYGDGTAGVWDTTLNSLNTSLTGGHAKRINSIGWSPDGAYLVTGSGDTTVALWNAPDGSLLRTYTGHNGYVNIAAWSPDGNLIASGGEDTVLQIWNPNTTQLLSAGVGHTLEIIDLAWSPDSSRVVTASKDGTAKIWDVQTGKLLLTYTGHRSFVVAVSWSPDGQKIVTAGGDHLNLPTDTSAQVWNASTGRLLLPYTRHTNEIESITWSPDSRRVASASDDGTVQIWPG